MAHCLFTYESQIISLLQQIASHGLMLTHHILKCAKSKLNPASHWLVNDSFLPREIFCKKYPFSVTSLWCTLVKTFVLVHPTHNLVHPRVHRAHRLKSAALGFRGTLFGNRCVNISEVATLVSMMPNFWCCLEVAAAELHLCFVIKGNVWWKRSFLMVAIAVLHHKHLKQFKPFIPHVIAWSVRKGFNQSIRRTKEQKTKLQCLDWAMPKSVMLKRRITNSGDTKSAKLQRRKSARIWQC